MTACILWLDSVLLMYKYKITWKKHYLKIIIWTFFIFIIYLWFNRIIANLICAVIARLVLVTWVCVRIPGESIVVKEEVWLLAYWVLRSKWWSWNLKFLCLWHAFVKDKLYLYVLPSCIVYCIVVFFHSLHNTRLAVRVVHTITTTDKSLFYNTYTLFHNT